MVDHRKFQGQGGSEKFDYSGPASRLTVSHILSMTFSNTNQELKYLLLSKDPYSMIILEIETAI